VEDRGGLDFTAASEDAANTESVCALFRLFGNMQSNLAQKRRIFYEETHRVREDWKQIELNDLKPITALEEKANRALSDKNYFVSQNQKNEISGSEERYKLACDELVSSIKALQQVTRDRFTQWTKAIAVARLQFYEDALTILQSSEVEIAKVQPPE